MLCVRQAPTPQEASGAPDPASGGDQLPTALALDAQALGTLVQQLRVRVKPGGGLSIEAPPQAAGLLAGALEQLAGQLRRDTAPR